jgi:hypothetical protein
LKRRLADNLAKKEAGILRDFDIFPQLEQGAAAQTRQDQETDNQGNDLFHKHPPGGNGSGQ